MAAPILTICILTHDDFDGVYFTIASIRAHHPEVAKRIRFTVVDNSPDSPHGKALYELTRGMPDVDYHQVRGVSSSTFKDLSIELARTEYVLFLDGHVLLRPNALARLIKFFETYPDWSDLIHGPLYNDSNHLIATHMEPNWRGGNFGTWAMDPRFIDETSDMFEIPLHGMGLFACARAAWPKFAGGMRAFGAEEGGIHEKFRVMGRKVWCFPFLGWIHRFFRPLGTKYTHTHEDKVRNYVASWKEACLPLDSIRTHYATRMYPADLAFNAKWIDDLIAYQKRLPAPYIQLPPDYKPFLGLPIQQLPDTPPEKD